MFAIVVERLDGMTEKAVCINGKWYPKFAVTFYADPENVKSGLYSVYMTGLDWIMNKNLSHRRIQSDERRSMLRTYNGDGSVQALDFRHSARCLE